MAAADSSCDEGPMPQVHGRLGATRLLAGTTSSGDERRFSGRGDPREDEVRKLRDEATRLRARAAEAAALRHELQAVKSENTTLQQALKEADSRADQAQTRHIEVEQRLLRVEAENTAIQESLREASELVEESVAGTSYEQEGLQRMQLIQSRTRSELGEISGLHKRLRETQNSVIEHERQRRELQKQYDQLHRDIVFLLSGIGEMSSTQDRTGIPPPLPTPDNVRSGHAQLLRLRSALDSCRAQLSDRERDIEFMQKWTHPSEPSPTSTVRQLHSSGTPAVQPTARSRQGQVLLEAARGTMDVGVLRSLVDDAVQLAEAGAAARTAAGDSEAELRSQLDRVTEELRTTQMQLRERAAAGSTAQLSTSGGPSAQLQQALRDLAEARAEAVRLREEKRRLLQAVKAAAAQRRLQDEHDSRRRRAHQLNDGSSVDSIPSEAHSDNSDNSSVAGGGRLQREELRRLRDANGQMAEELNAVREERDKLVDQLVAARASAQAAELLKIDTQDERRDLISKLEEAHARQHELQQRLGPRTGPRTCDRGTSPHRTYEEGQRYGSGVDDFGDLDDGLDVIPVTVAADQSCSGASAGAGGAGGDNVVAAQQQRGIDEYAFEQLKHTLEHVQQLLERSDQQLLDEKENSRAQAEQAEEMRSTLEKTLRDVSQLQHERDSLCVERDQWAQAARDADDARRKLIEHVEQLHTFSGSPRRGGGTARPPEVVELLRDKAELLVQIDILKERLADSTEELEGARRELVASLDARGELKREQDRNVEVVQALREAEAAHDKLMQEREQLLEDARHLRVQLENANLVKKCSNERLEFVRRETEEIRAEKEKCERELQAQMKEIRYLGDTVAKNAALYQQSIAEIEVVTGERDKLLAEKHRDLQRIEELSGKLTQVRLQNDKESLEERRQLQQEREFDALMLADRMKELDEAKEDMGNVKVRATKAINVLKVSLQNALMQMKALGDDFEVERADLKEQMLGLDKQLREKTSECESLKSEVSELQRRTGTEELRERVKTLSQGLDKTKEKFAEQTQQYEKVKAELRSARKALQENANFKDLFEAANEHTDNLTQKNRDLAKENKDLRVKLETVGKQEQQKHKLEEDEITQALRDQISALQMDLKREKDLRLRLMEENSRVREEQRSYEETTQAMLHDHARRLADSGNRLTEVQQQHQDALRRWAQEKEEAGGSAASLSHKLTMLQCEVDERDARAQELGRALDAKDTAVSELRDGLVACKRELATLADTMRRIETVADSFSSTPISEEEVSARDRRSRTEAAENTLVAVRVALEHLQQRCNAASEAVQGDIGRAVADYSESRADLSERLARAEEQRVCARDEASRLQGETRRLRDENAQLRRDLLHASDLSSNAASLQRRAEALQRDLSEALDERDQALRQMSQQRSGDSSQVAALRAASETAASAAARMQRDATQARQERDRAIADKDTLRGSMEDLNKTVKETQKSLDAAQRRTAEAVRERDEAAHARDRAVREKQRVEEDLVQLREELRRAAAEYARLQAVSQDLDGMSRVIDDSQGELTRTRELLDVTRAELRKLRASRDDDIAAVLEEQRLSIDTEVRDLSREKEELRRRVEALRRDKEAAEQALLHDRERSRTEESQNEQDRRAAAAELSENRRAIDEQQQLIQELRHRLALAAARGGDSQGAPDMGAIDDAALRVECAELRAELEQRRRETALSREEATAARDELHRLQQGAAESVALHGALAANADDLHSMARRLSRQEAELQRAAERTRAADAELAQTTARLREVEAALGAAESRCHALERELGQAQSDLMDTRRELDEGRDLMLSLVGPPEGVESREPSRQR